MRPAVAAYRMLIRLYPRGFRDRYRDDLSQHFHDLVTERGARAAWARTAMDLAVTYLIVGLLTPKTDQHASPDFFAEVQTN